jgi:hypothetical protein
MKGGKGRHQSFDGAGPERSGFKNLTGTHLDLEDVSLATLFSKVDLPLTLLVRELLGCSDSGWDP